MQGGQGLVDLGLGGVGVALHGLGSGQSGLEVRPALSGVVLLLQLFRLGDGSGQVALVHRRSGSIHQSLPSALQGGQGLVDLGLGGVGVALHGLGSGQSGLEVGPALSGVVIRIQCLCLCNGGSQIGLVYGLGQLDHHKGVLGDADHRGGSIGHSLSGDNGDVVGVFQSVFIGNALGGQGLNLHLIADEIHAGDIQLHRAVGFTVHIDQGDVDVPLVVLAGQSGQRGDAVGHGGSGIQLGGHHFVAESGVEHLKDMGGGSGEVLEFPFPGEGAGALLGHHLNDRLLSGAQGVAAGAVPVG